MRWQEVVALQVCPIAVFQLTASESVKLAKGFAVLLLVEVLVVAHLGRDKHASVANSVSA